MAASPYTFPLQGGIKFVFNGWTIGVWMNVDISGLGPQMFVGYEDPVQGWQIVMAVGPMPNDSWQTVITAAGGMGAYAISLLPRINAAMQNFNAKPTLPPETNQTPFTVQDFNDVWTEFFVPETPAPGQTYPDIKLNYT